MTNDDNSKPVIPSVPGATKDKRNYKLQIRIGSKDKEMLKRLREKDGNFNVSSFFRECLEKKYAESGLKGIGDFTVG